MTSFKIIENENYDILLLEDYPCENKMQLHAREGFWIKQKDCVNKCMPRRAFFSDGEEWRSKPNL